MKKLGFIILAIFLLVVAVGCQPYAEKTQQQNNSDKITDKVTGDSVINTTKDATETKKPKEEIPKDVEAAATVEAIEGDLIKLNPVAKDPDNDKLSYTFSEPFTNNGEWQSKEGDAGEYLTKVTVTDGKGGKDEEYIHVIIYPMNKAPTIEGPETIKVKEGETINVREYFKIYDVDEDEVIVSYSGWFTGKTMTIGYDEAGEHEGIITAEDPDHKTVKKVKVIVENTNRAPEFQDFPTEITAVEKETVKIEPKAADPDGDPVTFKYSEPFNAGGVWIPKVGDEGTYTVTVTATDGNLEVKKEVKVTILPANKAPVFKYDANKAIIVDEGDLIDLSELIKVEDPEGDNLQITYSGWMDSATYQTTYDDAGEYDEIISAYDGELTTTLKVKIIVNDKNRPPYFVVPA